MSILGPNFVRGALKATEMANDEIETSAIE